MAHGVVFDRLPYYLREKMVRESIVLCRTVMAQPGSRAFLDDYEARCRREGLFSPLILAALDEVPEEDDPSEVKN